MDDYNDGSYIVTSVTPSKKEELAKSVANQMILKGLPFPIQDTKAGKDLKASEDFQQIESLNLEDQDKAIL